MTHPPFLTVRQAAEFLGYSTSKIYKLLNDKHIPAGRLPGGTSIRIKRDDIEAFVEKMFVSATPDPDVSPAEPVQPKKKVNPPVKTILRPDGRPDFAAMARANAHRASAQKH